MKAKGIFDFMGQKDLTSLEILYSQRLDEFLMRGMKEWDGDLDFSTYAGDFTYLDILTEHYRGIGTEQVVAGLQGLGLGGYLERIEQLMRQGRHEGIEFYYHSSRNIRVAFCKHSVTLGRNNGFHAIRAGAMRRHELDEPELDVITDGLNLSRARRARAGCHHRRPEPLTGNDLQECGGVHTLRRLQDGSTVRPGQAG